MMCVGISAKVVSLDEDTAVIDVSGAKRKIESGLIEDLEPGDYVMVHAGMAIARITGNDADETDRMMESIE